MLMVIFATYLELEAMKIKSESEDLNKREENEILRSILDEMMKNNLLTAKQMYTDFKNNEIINEIEETTIDNKQNDNSGNSY